MQRTPKAVELRGAMPAGFATTEAEAECPTPTGHLTFYIPFD